MTTPLKPIDFQKVEALRRHMLLTVKDICMFFGVSRETYYNYMKGSYPRLKQEEKLRSSIRELLYAMTEHSWPMPDVIAAMPRDRYAMLLKVVGREDASSTDNERTSAIASAAND